MIAKSIRCFIIADQLVRPSWLIGSGERHFRSKISFYDALIVEAAIAGGAEILYSEDLSHEQRFDSLQVINPFLT